MKPAAIPQRDEPAVDQKVAVTEPMEPAAPEPVAATPQRDEPAVSPQPAAVAPVEPVAPKHQPTTNFGPRAN